MKTSKDFKRFLSELTLGVFLVTSLNPVPAIATVSASVNNSDKIVYPLKEIAKLECRFSNFKDLKQNCKRDLPKLNTKDYRKYASKNGGYNDYTRTYTELWGASYKYGWDVGNGGHIGIDIATSKGTPVYSMADGRVIKSADDKILGKYVSIEHKIKGKYVVSNYLHMSKRNVAVGDIIKAGEKLGEVGSTGNSTGNHLHFQIDLKTPFHPYYYDYKKCPFSYYKITEEGICFNELDTNTIDPLLFLETKGRVLDSIKTRSSYVTKNINTQDLSIFNRTVYIGYSQSDIKKVQDIFKKIGAYNGLITGDYKDLESSIIKYQLKNKLISSKGTYGAGWFGPKTRFQVKKDYLNRDSTSTTAKEKIYTVVKEKGKNTIKIDRSQLMSREDIEKKEVQTFLRKYNIKLDFSNQGSNIKKGTTEVLKLKITNKKGRVFKGEMPGGMTFIVNSKKINVFPKKLFYFTDGKRDIRLKGLSEGNTTLYIKIGKVTIKSIPLKVYKSGKSIYPKKAKILSSQSTTLGEDKTGLVLFQDDSGKNLINLPYGSTYTLKASGDNKVCIKKGNIKDIRKIYRAECESRDYINEITFSYKDTVGGLLIYDYKAKNKDFKLTLKNNYNNKKVISKTILVKNPKGLNSKYVYTNSVLDMLKGGIVDGIKRGYFMQKTLLNERDAYRWIENSLLSMENNSFDKVGEIKIKKNLADIKKAIKYSNKRKNISRETFLNLSNKYLVLNNVNGTTIDYKDTNKQLNIKIANVFDAKVTWKDKFGQNYFRPNEKMTRGEGAFFLSKVLEKTAHTYLTLK